MSEPVQDTNNGNVPARRLSLRQLLLLFLAALCAYALPAFDRLKGPSEHLHFVDLAESFMAGRLDTETPRQSCGSGKDRKGDPKGYRDFICRHSKKPDGSWEGWNDWASYHSITLKGGEVLEGVWRWGDTKGSDRHRFVTLDGELYVVDKSKDLKRGCDPKRKHALCDVQHHYVSFPPAPAAFMLPFAAVWHYRLNDVVWTVIWAAFGLVGLLLLLERLSATGRSPRSLRENVAITALIGFGTSLYFSSVRGEVWFTALVMGFVFHVYYLQCALGARRPLLAGLLLALGVATRTPLAFAFLFFAFELWHAGGWGTRLKRGTLFSLPILAVGAALVAYNLARFGAPLEFGHSYLQDGMRPSIRDHGLFSAAFLNNNLSAAFSNVWTVSSSAPFIKITRHGISIFACTPALLLALWPRRWDRAMTAALVSLFAVALPGLFYQNTGWAQFSYRFSIDYLPFFAVLLACGGRPLDKRFWALFAVSLLTGLLGAVTFGRYEAFYYG